MSQTFPSTFNSRLSLNSTTNNNNFLTITVIRIGTFQKRSEVRDGDSGGHTELIEGLETALPGCRKGDKVEIYMTFEQAYGNDYIGLVPNKSAVAWFIEILDVTKQR